MRLETRPGLSIEQRAAFFVAASPHVHEEILNGATLITAESDGDSTIIITSDRLGAPKVVTAGGE